MIRRPESVVSESRTYVVFAYDMDQIQPKVVKIPDEQVNNGVSALWSYCCMSIPNDGSVSEHQFPLVENIVMTMEEFGSFKM